MSGKRPDGKVDLVQQKEKILRNKVSMAVRSLLTIRDKKIREILRDRNEMKNAQQIVQSRQEYIKKCFKKEEDGTNLDVNRWHKP